MWKFFKHKNAIWHNWPHEYRPTVCNNNIGWSTISLCMSKVQNSFLPFSLSLSASLSSSLSSVARNNMWECRMLFRPTFSLSHFLTHCAHVLWKSPWLHNQTHRRVSNFHIDGKCFTTERWGRRGISCVSSHSFSSLFLGIGRVTRKNSLASRQMKKKVLNKKNKIKKVWEEKSKAGN